MKLKIQVWLFLEWTKGNSWFLHVNILWQQLCPEKISLQSAQYTSFVEQFTMVTDWLMSEFWPIQTTTVYLSSFEHRSVVVTEQKLIDWSFKMSHIPLISHHPLQSYKHTKWSRLLIHPVFGLASPVPFEGAQTTSAASLRGKECMGLHANCAW